MNVLFWVLFENNYEATKLHLHSTNFPNDLGMDSKRPHIQGVSGGIVNILGGGSMDYSE